MTSDLPLRLANAAGLILELNRDGGVRRIQLRDDVVNLFMGNGMEPGPTNVWLRLRRGGRVQAVPLLGPQSPLILHPLPRAAGERAGVRGPDRTDVFETHGEWQGLGIALRLVLAEHEPSWCWQVQLQNRSSEEQTVDLLYAQDIALASSGAVRLNEHYVSHYVDLSPLEHPRCGWVVAARQNLGQGGRHPWAVVGSLWRATSFATDGLQLFGLAQRLGDMPAGIRDGLPGQRLQHEHAMAAVQDEAVTLASGANWAGGFFVALDVDHPQATSVEDLAAVDAALSWARSLDAPPLDAPPQAAPALAAPALDAPPLDALPLDAPPLDAPPLAAPPLDALPLAALPLAAPPLAPAPTASPPLPRRKPGERVGVRGPASEDGSPADSTLFAVAPLLECRDLDEAELRRLFPPPWRHEERDGARLSFFCGEDGHVVLREKEARTQRPHGHILRTGQALVPEESSLTSTVWMSGVFHSMVTQGHVSINRFLSTVHSWLGLFRSHGLRIFVQVDGRWQLLGVPSAFEMRPGSCRWIYRHAHGAIELTSAVHDGAHALSLRGRVLDGPPIAWMATLHVALGGDDGNASLPIPWRIDGKDVVVGMPDGSDLYARFPDGAFVVAPHADTALAGVHGDGRLFTDGTTRGLPFLVLEGETCSAFGLDLLGRLVPDAYSPARLPALPTLIPPGTSAAAAEVGRLAEMLPWFLHDAQVHHLSPRGLEQYSGGGWGTRDVCQGPLEMLLALDCPDPARDLLLRVFAAQDEDGDWPQWFQFIDRERELRARDSHGDIVFWPLLATARYVLSTGDTSLLDAQVPFHSARGRSGRPATVLQHVDRALGVTRRRRVAGTALAAYGHGDWNDSLQPSDPSLRDSLCSTWTVILHHQTLTALAGAMNLAGQAARATSLQAEAGRIRRELRNVLRVDGVLAGYVLFSADAAPEPLLHPRDRRTGVRYSLLPMMHAILEDLLTPEEAAAHLALMREHLWAPDGARLFDRPLTYRGGIERLFQRAETSAFFGREIGLMYTHAHLRYAEMQAHVGDARGLLQSLALAHPVQLRERLPQASLRQANCYYSSSDAAFRDRYEAEQSYREVAAGTVALDGGWRVYSSGPGIALSLIVTRLLGVRREGNALVIDPVIAPELTGLRAEVPIVGRTVNVEYHVERHGYAPQAVVLNGHRLRFSRVDNAYRAGGAAIPLAAWAAALRADGSANRKAGARPPPPTTDVLRVELS